MSEIVTQQWPGSIEEFHALISSQKPVLWQGFASEWRCTRLWTMEYLRDHLASKMLTVTRSDGHQYRPDPEQGHYAAQQMRTMTFGEFADLIEGAAGDGGHYYLHKQSLDAQLPELLQDILVPNHISGSRWLLTSLWMGRRGSITPIHHDFTNNLFVQVRGRKEVILYEPEPEQAFYRLPFRVQNGRSSWHVSRVGSFETCDRADFPHFRESRPIRITVEQGDMLFIPIFYWHEVHSLDTPSISLSYWWDDKTQDEINDSIATISRFVQLYETSPVAWRSLLRRIVSDRIVNDPGPERS